MSAPVKDHLLQPCCGLAYSMPWTWALRVCSRVTRKVGGVHKVVYLLYCYDYNIMCSYMEAFDDGILLCAASWKVLACLVGSSSQQYAAPAVKDNGCTACLLA